MNVRLRSVEGIRPGRVAAFTAVCLALATSVAACGDDGGDGGGKTSTGPEKSDITMQLTEPNVLATPFYVAQEKGYFADEGLNVKFEYPGSTPRATQLVLAGQGDVAVPDPAGALLAKAQGQNIKSIWNFGDGSWFGFVVAEDSPITEWSAESVRGKKIGISEFAGGEVPLLRGALGELGLTEGEDVTLVPVGPGGPESADALETGKVDILAGSVIDFGALQGRGVKMREITPENIRNFPRNGFVLKADTVDQNPKTMAGMLRAMTKAMVYLHSSPKAAVTFSKKYAGESLEGLGDAEIVDLLKFLMLTNQEPYFDTKSPKYKRFGEQKPERWNEYQTFLVEGGVKTEVGRLEEEVPVDEIVDNEFIDAANDFDYAQVAAQAKADEKNAK